MYNYSDENIFLALKAEDKNCSQYYNTHMHIQDIFSMTIVTEHDILTQNNMLQHPYV